MNPTIATLGRSESTNTTVTVGPGVTWTGGASNWNVASTPSGHPAGGGSTRQIVKIGIRIWPPRSPPPSSGVSMAGVTGGMSPGSMTGGAVGVAPGAGVVPGFGVGPFPPPPPCGIGSTSGPTTSGGTPPGGKPHIAGTRPPPKAVPKASTTDAGHQSPS